MFLLGVTISVASYADVSNVVAEQRAGTRLVDITYDLAAESDVSVKARRDLGDPYEPISAVTGDVGESVSAGIGKSIVWDAESDFPNSLFVQAQVSIQARPAAFQGPYVVSGRAVSHGDPSLGLSGATIVATQYSDNVHIEAEIDVFGNWTISGLLGPARLAADVPGGPSQAFRMSPMTYEVNGPESDIIFQREWGDGSGIDLYPDLSDPDPSETEVSFADLDSVVRGWRLLNLEPEDVITAEMAASIRLITPTEIGNHVIADLRGAAYLTGLTAIDLSNQPVTDFRPLEGIGLTTLIVGNISELSPISNLTKVKKLGLSGFQGADLRALSEWAELEMIDLSYSAALDLYGIGNLPNLEEIRLTDSETSDLSPLQSLPALQGVLLSRSAVADIAPLASFSTLEWVLLNETPVSAIEPLLELPNLELVDLRETLSIDWQDVESSWDIVTELESRGVTVRYDADLPLRTFDIEGAFAGPPGIEVSLVIESGALGTAELQTVDSATPWVVATEGPTTITPSSAGYRFEPAAVTVDWNSPAVTFTMTRLWNSVGGTIRDADGAPVAGVEVRLTRTDLVPAEEHSIPTDTAGNFTMEYPAEAQLEVMPLSAIYAFEVVSEAAQPVAVVSGTGSIVDYTAHSQPDGLVAYLDGNSLALLNPRTGTIVTQSLIDPVASASSLAWSPDGAEIAYSEGLQRISAIGVDGNNQRTLVELEDFPLADPQYSEIDRRFSWSSQGEMVFATVLRTGSMSSGAFLLHTVTPPNRAPQLLESGDTSFSIDPSWSPDGERIVFRRDPDRHSVTGSGSGFKLHVVGSEGTDLTTLDLPGVSPTWSPQGNRIAYTDNENIQIVSIDGQNEIGSPRILEEGTNPAWSRDGRWIVFVRNGSLRIRSSVPGAAPSTVLVPGKAPAWQPSTN